MSEHALERRVSGTGPSRGWMRALGVGLVVLGAVAIAAAFAATLATVLFFGALLLVAGVAQIVHTWSAPGEHSAWELAAGVVYLAAGGLIVLDPASGAVGLTLLLAVFFFAVGLLRLVIGQRVRSRGGSAWAVTLSGALDVLLGALIVVGWPGTAGWVIGLFVGIELLFAGVSLIAAPREALRAASAASAVGR